MLTQKRLGLVDIVILALSAVSTLEPRGGEDISARGQWCKDALHGRCLKSESRSWQTDGSPDLLQTENFACQEVLPAKQLALVVSCSDPERTPHELVM
ncbi:hypothetical protein EVC45_42155 [Paraburkholderia sp. UYCP14C]|uniref:hypothetical protein n=1 Tax=Paraburkholderia sp. UYCP14C TaxID=2511130 RepID=UPI0010214796|nr:hypothetical protein [Paraburkholderia sp. UYCP14C]RZF23820.1 hypothetical protein EVC45_42155 [Paraburkholderia sp. UYCP14C]